VRVWKKFECTIFLVVLNYIFGFLMFFLNWWSLTSRCIVRLYETATLLRKILVSRSANSRVDSFYLYPGTSLQCVEWRWTTSSPHTHSLMCREKPSGKNLHKLPENGTQGCIHSILRAASETCVITCAT